MTFKYKYDYVYVYISRTSIMHIDKLDCLYKIYIKCLFIFIYMRRLPFVNDLLLIYLVVLMIQLMPNN